VILACRSSDKTLPVVEDIKEKTKNEKVEFMELDLSSLASVKKFADQFLERKLPLHLLLNNAGIMACPFGLTKDGIESQFGTNHVGHFYLTMLLLEPLEQSQPSRIVNLSSLAHTYPASGGIAFEKINDEGSYGAWTAYGQSKLANILFTTELQRRLEGKKIYVNAAHPGAVATELSRHLNNGFLLGLILPVLTRLFAVTPETGALTQMYLATHPDIEEKEIKGRYFVPTAVEGNPSQYAKDEDLAKKLWEFTENLLKEKVGDQYVPRLPSKEEQQKEKSEQ